MADTPPVSSIPAKQNERYVRLRRAFEQKYGKPPAFFARASGRVNIIGEHIDYHGYAVLPMAIEQDMVVAVSPTSDHRLRLANTQPTYSDFCCALSDFTINKAEPRWQHYFLCGVRGIAEHLQVAEGALSGMDVLLDGTLPPSAGLSSSSALVCAAALATAHTNGKPIDKVTLADICTHCEHHIGTEGGGMDQSISFLAQPGTAKVIEFNPIRATDVQLPAGAVFVIANSCAEINKAASAHFNTRVAEGRLATQLLAKQRGLEWRSVKRLGELQAALGLSLDEMEEVVRAGLRPGVYSKQEVCAELGVSAEELDRDSLSQRTWDVREFALRERALHVYSEAGRVRRFQAVCAAQPEDALRQLGALMDDSHESCARVYECSCPQLDALCQLARESGALGSRLTGAGWGGCCVSLVPEPRLPAFLEALKAGYYAADPALAARADAAVFASQPGGGAAIYTLDA